MNASPVLANLPQDHLNEVRAAFLHDADERGHAGELGKAPNADSP